MHRRSLIAKTKVVIVFTAVQAVLFAVLSPVFGLGVAAVAILLVFVAGWYWGKVVGVVAAVSTAIVNLGMAHLLYGDWHLLVDSAGVLGLVLQPITGWVGGYVGDLNRRLLEEAKARAAAESQVESHRRSLETVVSSAPVILFAFDVDGVLTLAEGAGLRGMRRDSYEGVRIEEIEAEYPEMGAALRRAMSGDPVSEVVDMGRRVFDVRALPGNASDGVAGGVLGVATDITERARSEQRRQHVFEIAPVALLEEDYTAVGEWLDSLRGRGVTDLRSHLESNPEEVARGFSQIHVLDVNRATIDLLGLDSVEQMLGPLSLAILNDGARESFIEQACAIWEDRDQVDMEMLGVGADGREVNAVLSWGAPRNSDGSLALDQVVVAITDITELRRAHQRLEQLIRSKDQFVASVSHELRTPMTAVVGLAKELQSAAGKFTPEETEEFHRLIAEQSQEVANIVEDLLVAARADIGRVSIHPTVFELGEIIEHVAIALTHPITVDAQSEPIKVLADPARVRQVIRNLITNASKYGGPRSGIEVLASGERAFVKVWDDGDALPEETRERIFQPYERAHSESTQPGSVGLGLTVSRLLARAMDGDLVYSREGGRNQFVLELPLAEPSQSTVPALAHGDRAY